MAAPDPNLFLRLHKWAARQDENFVTESLALVLQNLLDREPTVGVRFLSYLTGGVLEVAPEDAATVDVRPQMETERGRPDLELRAQGTLAVVEVKVEAELHAGQLEGYRQYLLESGQPRTGLILLTRYMVTLGERVEKPDLALRWYEVAEWLYETLAVQDLNPVTHYLCSEFLGFLEARNMTISQVNVQMAEGLRSLRSLLKMLEHAAVSCRLTVSKSSTWESIGFQLDKRYWVGVAYDEPDQLRFQTEACRINSELARSLGVGAVIEKSWAPNGLIWRRVEELNSEPVHFYARTRARQMQWLEDFISDCVKVAKQIETPA